MLGCGRYFDKTTGDMMTGEILSAKMFYHYGEYRRISDLTILPPSTDETKLSEEIELVRPTTTVTQSLPNDARRNLIDVPYTVILEHLYQNYLQQWNKNTHEPEWAGLFPLNVRKHLRRRKFLEMPELEHFSLPLAGIDHLCTDTGFATRVSDAFPLQRLRRVHQYGDLIDTHQQSIHMHSRYHHSKHVDTLAFLVGFNNRVLLNPSERTILRIAALTHDVATPAGGDATKQIAPSLDEDASYAELIKKIGIGALFKNACYSKKGINAAVQGKGRSGAILDMCDKIAYVAHDAFLHAARIYAVPDADVQPITDLIIAHPYPCGLWSEIKMVDRDTIVFLNPVNLAVFLKLRALMFKHCYLSTTCKKTWFPIMTTVPYLLSHGVLSEDMLRNGDDAHLAQRISDHFDPRVCSAETINKVCVLGFATAEEARMCEQQLLANDIGFYFLESMHVSYPGITEPLDTFMVQHEKKICSLREACEDEAQEIEAIAHEPLPYRVYYMKEPPVHSAMAQKMLEFRRKGCGVI